MISTCRCHSWAGQRHRPVEGPAHTAASARCGTARGARCCTPGMAHFCTAVWAHCCTAVQARCCTVGGGQCCTPPQDGHIERTVREREVSFTLGPVWARCYIADEGRSGTVGGEFDDSLAQEPGKDQDINLYLNFKLIKVLPTVGLMMSIYLSSPTCLETFSHCCLGTFWHCWRGTFLQ